MPSHRLLAIDIDGTLVNSRDELTPATLEALQRAGEEGVQIVLATGRRYSKALPLVKKLKIDVPLVTASGALVKDPIDHRTLFAAQFKGTVLRDTLCLIDRCGYDSLVCCDHYAEGFDFYYRQLDVRTPELAEYLEVNPNDGREWPNMYDAPPPGIFTAFAMGTKDQMLVVQEKLHEAFPDALSTHVLRSPKYRGFMVEIQPSGVTKWSSIQRLAVEWGIADEEICAVGDDVNDILMIRQAGLGIAMGNAVPEVKAAADRIAPTHDDDGLVAVVNWLLG